MTGPELPDNPAFDLTAFEAAAIERVNEFTGQVSRLATYECENSFDWIEAKGAVHFLPDGSHVAVKHETWDNDPDKIVVKAAITKAPEQFQGADGQQRRVTLTRYVLYRSFLELDALDAAGLERWLPKDPVAKELGLAWLKSIEDVRLEAQIDPGYRPSELIWACTDAVVERKLANGPNYCTENFSKNMPEPAKTAHIAARRHAGEPVTPVEYDVAEHKALMVRLRAITPRRKDMWQLDDEFDEAWRDPMPTVRSWMPKKDNK
ncbi:MAG TPA: hypothetical protein VJR27_01565 [Candidatus Saccharimonadales bacterium]|nr:hypothetical protein [Candidatus Saccharimonadales bacterium]